MFDQAVDTAVDPERIGYSHHVEACRHVQRHQVSSPRTSHQSHVSACAYYLASIWPNLPPSSTSARPHAPHATMADSRLSTKSNPTSYIDNFNDACHHNLVCVISLRDNLSEPVSSLIEPGDALMVTDPSFPSRTVLEVQILFEPPQAAEGVDSPMDLDRESDGASTSAGVVGGGSDQVPANSKKRSYPAPDA